MAGQWYNCFSDPLHRDNLAAEWVAGKGTQQYFMGGGGVRDGHCALNLEGLDAEHTH